MICPSNALAIAKYLHNEFVGLGMSAQNGICSVNLYDVIITNWALREKTEKLFKDGHYARSIEEAYKLLDNLVKEKANLSQTGLTGSKLMEKVFSVNKPILKLNEGNSLSMQNEQSGYMQILSGCMIGIRNPRAHESDWEDTEPHAIQLLTLANHLIERVMLAEIVPEP